MIDAKALTEVAADKALQEPEAAGDRAGPLHRDPRAARQRALPLADDRHLQRAAAPAEAAAVGNYFGGKAAAARTQEAGRQDVQRSFTLKSDIGNPILRQTPIGTDGMAGAGR